VKSESRRIHRDVGRRFSAAAGGYDAHADVQRDAAEKLLRLIPDCEPERILDLGCGTGVLTELLAARWPHAAITAVDVAPGMIEALRARLPRAHAYVADIACLARNPVFDLVASNCALHWIIPFSAGIGRVAGQLAPGGIAAISVMLDGTLRELHEARNEAAPQKSPAGKMPAEDEVVASLRSANLDILRFEDESQTGTMISPRAVFESLRAQGLTAGHLARGERPLTRNELTRTGEIYARRFVRGDGVAVTYRVGRFIAGKTK
jgi:malonyl-CoA O-methyltransferase